MADSQIGRSDLQVHRAGVVDRPGSSTEQQRQRNPRQERRDEEPRKRRRIYDMLFDEIDQIDALNDHQKARIKNNIRAHVIQPAPTPSPTSPSPTSPPPIPAPPLATAKPAEADEEELAERLLADPNATAILDPERFFHVAAPAHLQQPTSEAEENAQLSRQLRDCLALQTERARKVAVYLHILLTRRGSLRPNLVLDI